MIALRRDNFAIYQVDGVVGLPRDFTTLIFPGIVAPFLVQGSPRFPTGDENNNGGDVGGLTHNGEWLAPSDFRGRVMDPVNAVVSWRGNPGPPWVFCSGWPSYHPNPH